LALTYDVNVRHALTGRWWRWRRGSMGLSSAASCWPWDSGPARSPIGSAPVACTFSIAVFTLSDTPASAATVDGSRLF
jgi:hypothetical protein